MYNNDNKNNNNNSNSTNSSNSSNSSNNKTLAACSMLGRVQAGGRVPAAHSRPAFGDW